MWVYTQLCVCVYASEQGEWGDEVWVFKQNGVVASHPEPWNTKPSQMSLWRSSWINQCLFTFFSFFSVFSFNALLIQEMGRKVSLDVFTFSETLQFSLTVSAWEIQGFLFPFHPLCDGTFFYPTGIWAAPSFDDPFLRLCCFTCYMLC